MWWFHTFKVYNRSLHPCFYHIKPQIHLKCIRITRIYAKPNLIAKHNERFFSSWFGKLSESTIKKNDKIDPEYKLVYNTTLDKYLVLGQIVTTTIGSALALTLAFCENITSVDSVPTEPNMELVLFASSLCFCILVVHRIIARVPIRIYKSQITKEYVFICRGALPFSKNYFTCVANELRKVEEVSPFLPWKESTYKLVKNNEERKLVLMDYYFKRPVDLNILLGYQKEDE